MLKMGLGFKDPSDPRHRDPEAAATGAVSQLKQQGELLDLTSSKINYDFEHECLETAIARLGAVGLEPREEDMGPIVYGIPGVPQARFLPHQISAI